MKYELYQRKNKWFIRANGDDKNTQASRIFNYMMTGDSITRPTSVRIGGGIKLPSRISEINEALARLDESFNVSHLRVDTKHGGFYFQYFLTSEQRDQINDALLGVTA